MNKKEQELKRLYNERYDLLQKHRLLSLSQADQQALEDITKQIDELEEVAPRYDVIDALFTRTAKLCFEIAYKTAREISALDRLPKSSIIYRVNIESRKKSRRDIARRSREKRLRLLGFEDVSEEMRKKNLEFNMAVKDWSK